MATSTTVVEWFNFWIENFASDLALMRSVTTLSSIFKMFNRSWPECLSATQNQHLDQAIKQFQFNRVSAKNNDAPHQNGVEMA